MKKHNFVFVGECVIVIALLVLIGLLIKDDNRGVQKEKTANSVVVSTDELEKVVEDNFVEASSVKESEDLSKVAVETSVKSVSNREESVSDNDVLQVDEDKVKIVVFGDSIWNEGRGTDGISEQVMEQLDVEIYNCAIGGTTAAVDGDVPEREEWDSRSFCGMVYVARGIIDADELMPDDAACEVIKQVDFNEVDYVIVSYGLNDYFSDITVYPKEYYDKSSYVGALRYGIHRLQKSFPHLEIILTSPTYCEWFKGERQFELGRYVECARGVAQEMDVHFLDMYHALGKNPEEKMEYLSDGVHLTSEGRALYANSVIEYLKQLDADKK